MMGLTKRQAVLWRLRSLGFSVSEIARRLGISRQAVHKNLQAIESKVYRGLISTANTIRIEIRKIDIEKGYLVGWSPGLNMDVYITFSTKNGIQVWFKHEGECRKCPLRDECRKIILSEAIERNIELPKEPDIEPTKLADIFFKKLTGE